MYRRAQPILLSVVELWGQERQELGLHFAGSAYCALFSLIVLQFLSCKQQRMIMIVRLAQSFLFKEVPSSSILNLIVIDLFVNCTRVMQ